MIARILWPKTNFSGAKKKKPSLKITGVKKQWGRGKKSGGKEKTIKLKKKLG